MGPGTIPEIIDCEQSLPCHPQMQVKPLSCKTRLPYVTMMQKHHRLLWTKMDWGKVENCFVVRIIKIWNYFFIEIMNSTSPDERDLPAF